MNPAITIQSKICAILKSFQRGDFSTFKHACSLAGVDSSAVDRYFYSNYFLAVQIGGLIEVSSVDSSTRWWAAFDQEIEIPSSKPKVIGTTEKWFHESSQHLRNLITDENGSSLLIGKDEPRISGEFFGVGFGNRLPSLPEVENEVLLEEPSFYARENYFEWFDPINLKWNGNQSSDGSTRALIRMRKRFGGVEHFIIYNELGLAFRILNPEWAHFLAGKFLSWDWSSTITQVKGQMTIPRGLRLPNVLYRFLFANSHSCHIGSTVVFKGLNPVVQKSFNNYFTDLGEMHGI